MVRKEFPCGRTREDKHLCCARKHHWWNTKKVVTVFGWDIRCRICGRIVVSSNCKIKKDVRLW